MTRLPPDLPDDGPSIPERFRVHPEAIPTEGEIWAKLALWLVAVTLGLGIVLTWGMQ